ncbi:MAG: GAF domain-containing protein [Calditrichaeota bacterium]|nr:MAG: GAF domain-containing protein [Calditrichota bacterium]
MKFHKEDVWAYRDYFFLAEILLFTGVLHAFNLLLNPANPGFVGVSPNPHWITVLLIASRYGLLQGIIAGAASAAIYVYFAAQVGVIDFHSMRFPHQGFRIPFLFILTGAILGQIRLIYKTQKHKLDKQLSVVDKKVEDLNVLLVAVSTSKQELEKRIATQTSTLLSLFDRLNQIDISETDKLYTKILEMLSEQLQVQTASIYTLDGNKLVLQERYDPDKLSKLPQTLNLTDGLIGTLFETRSLVSINPPDSEAEWESQEEQPIMMAVPMKRQDDSLLGVINIERIPFLIFNHHAIRIFNRIGDWVSTLLDKRMQIEEAGKERIYDPASGNETFTYAYFQSRLHHEMIRARQFEGRLSLALLRIERYNEMTEDIRKDLHMVLGAIFKRQLCDTVIIGRYKWPDAYAIIFTGFPDEIVQQLTDCLLQEITNYQFKPFEQSQDILAIRAGVSRFRTSMRDVGKFESEVEKKFSQKQNPDLDLSFLELLNGTVFDSTELAFDDMHFVENNKVEFEDISFLHVDN